MGKDSILRLKYKFGKFSCYKSSFDLGFGLLDLMNYDSNVSQTNKS